jgi:hypothetical protein
MLAFLAALAIAFLGLGWYLDWYKIHPVSSQAGHQTYTVDINAEKIGQTVQAGVRKGGQEIQDLLQPKGEPVAAPKEPGKPADGKVVLRPWSN